MPHIKERAYKEACSEQHPKNNTKDKPLGTFAASRADSYDESQNESRDSQTQRFNKAGCIKEDRICFVVDD